MARQYAQLPTQSPEDEMEAAFESDPEDDDHDERNTSSRPLLASHPSSQHPTHPLDSSHVDEDDEDDIHARSHHHSRSPSSPGTYDFEYDYANMPPPGSPPRPTPLALPNAYGNSNGLVPTAPAARPSNGPHRSLLRRAFGAIIPTHYARDRRGGGMANDGVFGNVVAKPGGPAPVRGPANSDGVYWAPEEVQKDAPPSYQSAQADAVPPYWENTILAPSGPMDGDMIIDGLPVGSVFAFLWNLLVSVSFQFVGFALTFLLHTTHAASFGSRAGLGITLIQYGFYMRSADASVPVASDDNEAWGLWSTNPTGAPVPPTVPEAPKVISRVMGRALPLLFGRAAPDPSNSTIPDPSNPFGNDNTTFTTSDWLSFFLMTVGWFLLITSLLGFWRVKRWERGIQASTAPAVEREPTPEEIMRDQQVMRNLEQAFGLEWSRPRSRVSADAQREEQTAEGDSRPERARFRFL